jgi:ubiquinone/menaquinone biosynthesis C-methylase UbiE
MADSKSRTSHPTTTGNFYDERYAGDYMDTDAYSVWGHGDLRTRQVIETLSHVNIQPDRVLDYGCGVGSWIGVLSRIFPNAEVSGVDISNIAIKKARERFPKYRLETFDGVRAPFGNEEFELVFSYHVLEHVTDIDLSVRDIARMLKPGGYAVIIFPCGNKGSFLDRFMRLVKNAWVPTPDGRMVLFFEMEDGHVRRMTSSDTVAIFEENGLQSASQLFSGHFFGTVDWLCRGTGPAYINKVFSGKPSVGRFATIRLELARRMLIAIHRLILRKSLDLSKRRNPVKQAAVFLVKQSATLVDRLLTELTSLEWRLLKRKSHGTAQYLVFRKG